MSFQISPNLPANVVEIGQELSQAKLDELNAGVLATQSWVGASYLSTATASSTYQTQAGMSSYLTTASAGTTYQTQAGMSSYLTTSSASATYAPKASPTFTGTVTIPAGASISGYLTTATASSTYQTTAGMSSYLTTATAGTTYQTQAGMSSYLTTATAGTTYQTQAGMTSYAPKASPTFTGTVTIPAGASISGFLTTAIASSTYATIAGMSSYLTTATAASTYQTQSGMSSYLTTSTASTTYASKASPTFTGTVTIPSGASISGYLTTSSASSTYQTISGMSSYAPISSPTFTGTVTIPSGASIGGYATQSYVTTQGYIGDAPSNGNEYVRKNAAWAIASGGGGGGGGVWGSITGTLTDQTDLTSYVTGLGYQTASDVSTYVTGLGYITSAGLSVTNIDLTGDFNGYNVGSGNYTFKWTQSTNTLRLQDGAGSGISISDTAITFPNSTTLTKAPFPRQQIVSTSITLAAGDENKLLCITGSMASIYIPPDSSVNFAVGTEFVVVVEYTGTSIVYQGSMGSPYINGSGTSPYSIPRYVTRLVKVGADTWYID